MSWSAVSGSGITYTVCYSTNSGTQSSPPPGANCGAKKIAGISTTLGSVSGDTTYYIWVRAESSSRQGPYSDRVQQNACNGISSPGMLLLCVIDHSIHKLVHIHQLLFIVISNY